MSASFYFMDKVIVTDLDGTLFYPKKKRDLIFKKNLYFLQSFIDDGGKVVIASGRSLNFGIKVSRAIGREVDLISYNGGCIYSNKEIIYNEPIAKDEIRSIIDDINLNFHPLTTMLFTNKGVFAKALNDNPILIRLVKFYFKTQKELAEVCFYKKGDFEKALDNEEVFKILIIFGTGRKAAKKARETNKIIRNSYENIEASWSGVSIEITSKDVNKGRSLNKYCELNNIDRSKVYVVGDSGNDISMFKEFYEHSFCMSHANKSVKKYAKYNLDKFEDLSRYIYEK